MAAATNFSNLIASLNNNILRPIVSRPARDLINAATLKTTPDGRPTENQEGFHPYGAIVVATAIAVGVLGLTQLAANITIPYSVRSHVILASRIAVGACLFHLIGIAIESIRKQPPEENICNAP